MIIFLKNISAKFPMSSMIDNPTVKLSIISSIAGILLLYMSAAHTRPALTPISNINQDYIGLKTKISGKVIDLHHHPEGHLFLKIKDESGGVITVPIFNKTNSQLDNEINILDNVEVEGQVKEYEGQLEIIPEEPESLQIAHSTPLKISNVTRSKLGKIVKTRGYVAEKKIVGSGSLLLELTQNGEIIEVFIPKSVTASKNFPEFQSGNLLQVVGLLQTYEGKLEIKVEDSYNIKVKGAPE